MLGIQRLAYWAHQYGFGTPTGIDLPDEASGIVPDEAWKQATFGQAILPGELVQAGIGQGFDTSTPLQILNAYAALANGGTLYQPQVVRQITGPDGTVVRPFKPIVIRKIAAPASVFTTMRIAARQVVTSRHTYNLTDEPFVIAGKTGTAEFGAPRRPGPPAVPQLVRRLPAPPRRRFEARLAAGCRRLQRGRQHGRQLGDGDGQVLPPAAPRHPSTTCAATT